MQAIRGGIKAIPFFNQEPKRINVLISRGQDIAWMKGETSRSACITITVPGRYRKGAIRLTEGIVGEVVGEACREA